MALSSIEDVWLAGTSDTVQKSLTSEVVFSKGEVTVYSVVFENISHSVSGCVKYSRQYENHCEKTGLRGFRPGPTQTGLCSHTRWLEA